MREATKWVPGYLSMVHMHWSTTPLYISGAKRLGVVYALKDLSFRSALEIEHLMSVWLRLT